jgi:ABC-2 type transport system permease protein
VTVLRAIVGREVRDLRRSPLTWGISLGLLSALELAIYPGVHDSLGKALSSYPDALKSAFNIESIDTPAQFLNGEMFSLVIPLAVAFFAIRAAIRPIVGYEEHHWLDTLMALPVPRRTLVAGAFISSAIVTAGILVVTGVLIWISGEIFGATIAIGDVAAGVAEVWPLALGFAGVALILCGRFSNTAPVTAGAAGLLVAMYVIDLAAKISGGFDAIGPLSAFHYVGSALVDGLDWLHFAGMIAVAVVLAALGALLFERRDLRG